jgi:hypothetical protein
MSSTLQPGDRYGAFVIVAMIGAGGNGTVYDPSLKTGSPV